LEEREDGPRTPVLLLFVVDPVDPLFVDVHVLHNDPLFRLLPDVPLLKFLLPQAESGLFGNRSRQLLRLFATATCAQQLTPGAVTTYLRGR
jgi:hypothetical protein